MGYGSYSAKDWSKLKQSRNLSENRQVNEIFTRHECDPKFDPKYIGTRECFDSEDHPKTTPIVVGLDVTGSMGYLAVKVASESLNELITKLYSTDAVEDPALMCAAYGDYMDKSPLQVTQFESDIRIAEQLLNLYFENRGQGMVVPTLLWEFLAKHTNIDAINKRGEKGYLFTIGDCAIIRENEFRRTVKEIVGDDLPFWSNMQTALTEVEEKFNVFHIMLGDKDGNPDILPGHKIVLNKNDIGLIPDIILGTIRMCKGESYDRIVSETDPINQPILLNALAQLTLSDGPVTL